MQVRIKRKILKHLEGKLSDSWITEYSRRGKGKEKSHTENTDSKRQLGAWAVPQGMLRHPRGEEKHVFTCLNVKLK